MSKQKGKAQAQASGLYKSESIKDVAESFGISNLSEAIASALASDVEYRMHQVIEEAARFTRHARRTTMTTSDIDQALRVLNIEPLYGHAPHNPPTFRRALPFPSAPTAGPVYFVEDEEIDFDRVLREEKITLPKPASYTAHWLAVEGVQPNVPENPPAAERRDAEPDIASAKLSTPPRNGTQFPPTPPSPSRNASFNSTKPNQLLVKQVLSRELQLYYTRLTSTLMPPTLMPPADDTRKAAALSSLRNDAGLQTLLPYLVKWVGDGVIAILRDTNHSENDGRALEVYLEVIGALLDNSTLFVEPYLHQMLPPLLSILLHTSLPSNSTHLRIMASQTLSHLLTQHSTTYPSLSPRIMKTLLLALLSPGKSKGTREGAVRGLIGVGKEAVRKGLVEGGGARIIGSECAGSVAESVQLISSVMDAFKLLASPSAQPRPLNPANPDDASFMADLGATLGRYFAARVSPDAEWAKALIAKNTLGSPMEL
ncbi:TAF-domain-containing protein [Fomitiporia mediterranea MF3/22]|uniref:TAF-domain-containing protein n=1 Tax=Fomitiporia mediterranea (strain MF3/22) TaxID=694068 RepID=UPI000440801A|nr:TAF-domain-containing protein [Fomitiporia mediterranea MF3/22]EJC98929.1 TAF-domain-containing protein [Fomitiporia mediterranea MF3/22]